MIASWFGVLSGSALDDPDHRCPGHRAGAFFKALLCGRFFASMWPTSAHFLLPASNYLARKFTRLNANASAGLRPHFKQGFIATEQFALRDLADFRTRPLVRCHF